MPTGFRLSYKGAQVDLDDVYVRKYFFGSNTGYLWTWGQPTLGILGDDAIIARSSPVQTVARGFNWAQISAGSSLSCGVKTDGTLWTWGSGSVGRLGDNSTVSKSSPVQTVAGGTNWKEVIGASTCVATKTDGTLWTWGFNSGGQLGDNTSVNKSSPVQTVTGGTNWVRASAGANVVAAIKSDGTLWTWGANSNGQLGDNTTSARSSPVQTVAGGTNWSSVCASNAVCAAIKTDGTLWLWGQNPSGVLGDNSIVSKSSPVQTVAGGANWRQVSSTTTQNIAAIKSDGTLWTWGSNGSGQLGDNTTINRSSPVQTIAGGTNWKQVSAGNQRCLAIKTDGTLWAWGLNNQGAIGDDSIINRSSPVQVQGKGIDWQFVSNYTQVLALKSSS